MAEVAEIGAAIAAQLSDICTKWRFMAEFKALTEQEFDAITERTAKKMERRLLAVDARFDPREGRLIITLNNGAVVGFPLSAVRGLEHAKPADLRHIEVKGGGYALRVESLDADISVPQLLADQLGSTLMKRAIKRASASRANGRLGGRPRKPMAV
jgi:protein involved in temperature-dependent protein secretion